MSVSQPPRHKEELQIDKDICKKKIRGVVCSELFWGSLEAVFLGYRINNS